MNGNGRLEQEKPVSLESAGFPEGKAQLFAGYSSLNAMTVDFDGQSGSPWHRLCGRLDRAGSRRWEAHGEMQWWRGWDELVASC